MRWLAGGLAAGTARASIWPCAVVFEYSAPAAGFYTPGLGRSLTRDWTIEGGHLAERCQLFIMIALGESIVDTGVAASRPQLTFSPAVISALVLAFLSSVALWWVYFDRSASASSRPGRWSRRWRCSWPLALLVAAVAGSDVILAPAAARAS